MTTNFEICDFMRQRGKSTPPPALSSLYAICSFNHPPPPMGSGVHPRGAKSRWTPDTITSVAHLMHSWGGGIGRMVSRPNRDSSVTLQRL